MKRPLWLLGILLAVVISACAPQAFAIQWNDMNAGNPVLPGYFADPCCRKFGDTYYMYVTPDGWNVGEGPFCIWTSKDFVHWTANKSNWPTTNQKWAPCVIYANGKYYMYTQVACQVYVATSTTPLGPWTNAIAAGGPMILDQTPTGTITLDGEIFIDTDNQAYMMYGTWWTPTIMKLNPDLISWTETPIQYFNRTGYTPPNGTVSGCMEAPYMIKRNGIYYYMYSDYQCGNTTYQVKYSTSTSPMGPFTYGASNPILSTNADNSVAGPGHHTILEDGGKVYIIYHRHDNPHHADGSHRQTAVDELKFNADGSIQKVIATHNGVGYLAPTTKKDTNWVVDPSLTVTATASSSLSSDFAPQYAADENNGTLWKAISYTYPQWVKLDLGAAKSVKRIETEFQYAQVGYKYLLEYSTNGTTWTMFADRRTNTAWGPMIDTLATAVSARYVRITVTGDDTPSRPSPAIGIWNLKIYDGVDKANRAPYVDAGPSRTGSTAFPTIPISGKVVDDGQPNGPVTSTWSMASGPGTVTFADANAVDTTATFSTAGTYVLQLLTNDGALSSFDTVTYTITSTPGAKLVSYSFDEPSGTLVQDASNNCRDAFFASDGDVKNNPVRGSGVSGTAVSFDGANDCIAVSALGTYTSFSIAAWVKLDRLPDYAVIFAGNGSATGTPQLSVRSTGEIQFSVIGASAADKKSIFKFTDAYLGRWTHIAATYDKAAKRIIFYVNGIPEAAQTYTTAQSIVLTSGSRIGAWNSGTRYFDGKIDEFTVYNAVLTPAEVSNLAGGLSFQTISNAKKLADGQSITLIGKSITYAPRSATLARSTRYFYIEEPDRSCALRVEDGAMAQDTAEAKGGMTLTGIMRTSLTTGERYLELTSPPEAESGTVVKPVLSNNKSINGDKAIVGMLVNLAGKVKSITSDRTSMVISDGSGKDTTVKCEYGSIGTEITASNMIYVVGVVSNTSPTARVLLMREAMRLVPPIDPMVFGLQEYYKFNETSGNLAVDSSGNSRNATTYNGPTWVAGYTGNCLNFDGINDYMSIPDMGFFQGVTIVGWFNLGVIRDWEAIMHCDNFDANDMHLSFRTNGQLFLSINGNTPTDVETNAVFTSSSINTWKHIAVVYDSAAKVVNFYVNGALFKSTAYSVSVPANFTGGIKLGSWGGGDRWFKGKMDDLRFYGRALTATEITNLYSAGYTITATAGANGSISPSGAVAVGQGGTQTFTMTPSVGYKVSGVTVDGVSVGAVSTYTFNSISANHTIAATFATAPNLTITASAGSNGAISPAGAVSVASAANQTFTMTPSPGYAVASVLVDGVNVGAVSTYTFNTVTANHTISATFALGGTPIAWLKFDETTGTSAADFTGHGWTGTLTNGPTWLAGKYSNAVNLDGTDDFVSLPAGVVNGLNDFTITAWVKLDANSTWNRIFDFGTGTSNYMFLCPKSGSGFIRYAITIGGGEQIINGTAALATGSWQHVAVTLSGTTGTIYVNGASVGTNASMTLKPSSLGSTTQNWIGRSMYADPYFDGMVDDFRIYNRGLSGSEITQIFNGN